MPIPPLDDLGFLPEGVHDCSLDEVEERFGCFQTVDRRVFLFERLREFLIDLKLSGKALALIIDGSFTTGKADPSDIDLIIVVPADYDRSATLKPFEYNTLNKKGAQRAWKFDVFALPETSDDLFDQIQFFEKIRGHSDRKKGMLRVEL